MLTGSRIKSRKLGQSLSADLTLVLEHELLLQRSIFVAVPEITGTFL